MLQWPAGPHPADGVWAPHWYEAVRASTSFKPPSDLPVVPSHLQPLLEACLVPPSTICDSPLTFSLHGPGVVNVGLLSLIVRSNLFLQPSRIMLTFHVSHSTMNSFPTSCALSSSEFGQGPFCPVLSSCGPKDKPFCFRSLVMPFYGPDLRC